MESRTELLAKSEDAKAKADAARLEYGEKFAGKADLSEADEKAAGDARIAIAKLDADAKRFADEAAMVPELNEDEKRNDADEVDRDPYLRYLAKGWAGCSEEEVKNYSGKQGFVLMADVAGNPRLDRSRPASADRPTGVYPVITEDRVFDALTYYGGVRQGASVVMVADGNIHNVPRHDSASEKGLRITSENTQAVALDYPEFTNIAVEPFTYTSRKMVVSKEALADARVDLMARMTSQLMRRIARAQNEEFTVTPSAGAANTKPEGLLSGASAGITAASATQFTWQETLDLINSMDVAYLMGNEGDPYGLSATLMGRRGFMCHQNVLNFICKLSAQGRPVLPRQDAANISDPLPKTLWGWPIIVNNDMPGALTTGQEVLLFGDFGQYEIRDVSNSLEVKRLEGDTHGAAYQVALVAFLRSTGIYTGRKEAVRKLTLG